MRLPAIEPELSATGDSFSAVPSSSCAFDWSGGYRRSARLFAQRVILTLSGCTRVFWNDRINQSAPDFTRT